MARFYESISPELQEFALAQHIFFVATAPLQAEGHVNLSPKGMDTFRILSANRVAYLDLTGSGNETAAHLMQNGRITFMFCAMQAKPMILRFYGTGRSIRPDSPAWTEFSSHFTLIPGARQIIVAEITKVQTSCGYAVPLMTYDQDRDTLLRWAETKGPDGLRDYRLAKNSKSIDGLPTSMNMEL